MVRKKLIDSEIESQKKEQTMRVEASRADRRSRKSMKTEGKVEKSKAKAKTPRSSKKIATVRKSRY